MMLISFWIDSQTDWRTDGPVLADMDICQFDTIWEFIGNGYQWQYDDNILPHKTSRMIQYENCWSWIIISDTISWPIWYDIYVK